MWIHLFLIRTRHTTRIHCRAVRCVDTMYSLANMCERLVTAHELPINSRKKRKKKSNSQWLYASGNVCAESSVTATTVTVTTEEERRVLHMFLLDNTQPHSLIYYRTHTLTHTFTAHQHIVIWHKHCLSFRRYDTWRRSVVRRTNSRFEVKRKKFNQIKSISAHHIHSHFSRRAVLYRSAEPEPPTIKPKQKLDKQQTFHWIFCWNFVPFRSHFRRRRDCVQQTPLYPL